VSSPAPTFDRNYGPLVGFTDVEKALIDHIKGLIHPWLGARERQQGIAPGTLARPRSYIRKQTFTALPGQEQTPAIIVVSDGFLDPTRRAGTGSHSAFLRFAVAAFVMANEQEQTRDLAGHYQAALIGLCLKHRTIGPGMYVSALRDLKVDDVDEEAAGRSMCAVRIELTYQVDNFAEDLNPPVIDPDLPVDPSPDDPLVHEVIVETEVM
jgi:hypothetical protein